MKLLRLLFFRFALYFRRNRLIFCLMILSGVMTAIMLLYSYGNLLPIVFNRTSDELYYRTYTAQINPVDVGDETLSLLKESDLLSQVELRIGVDAVHGWVDEIGVYHTMALRLAASINDQPKVVTLSGTTDFLETGDHSVMVTNPMYSPGDVWKLMDEDYTVVAQISGNYEYVSLETFYQILSRQELKKTIELGNLVLDDSGVTVISKERYHSYQEDEVLALLQEVFPDAEFETPYIYRMYDETNSYEQAVYMCILYAIAMISFLLLFLYLVEKTADVMAIYRIVGASRTTVAIVHFGEVLLLSLGSSLLGVLVHGLLYQPLFSKMNLVRELSYRFSDYCLALLAMVAITLLLSLPFIWRATRLSPVAARRAAE